MPKIEVNYAELSNYLGKKPSMSELEQVFPAAKAELDEALNAEGTIKVELNDTNRPDLWSTAGLARCIKTYQTGVTKPWNFFSGHLPGVEKSMPTIKVDLSVQEVRPFVAGFVAKGKAVDQTMLASLIQSQEKLCWNFGQKRKGIAMGIYRADLINFPVSYKAVAPDSVSFVALGMEKKATLSEILRDHPKGKEFGHILAQAKNYPILLDAKGDVLSFPPIINSNDLGAVKLGDDKLFVELTGTELQSLMLACNIIACDMADMGFTIEHIEIEYPSENVFGTKVVSPLYFQKAISTNIASINKLLGQELSGKEIVEALQRMGNQASIEGQNVTLLPAAYRNDFLHEVDIIEDVMIGRGMDSFESELPRAFTVGRLTDTEILSRKVKSLMVGLGYQEMIFNYLGSARDYIWKMDPDLAQKTSALGQGESLGDVIPNPGLVQISNPMSENFEFVRASIVPCLLNAEAFSANAPYPHLVFEVGKTAIQDRKENYGSRTETSLGFLAAKSDADFNFINAHLQALMYYLGWDYVLKESDKKEYMPGRRAEIIVNGKSIGVFGELHPGVLENWGITVPCVAAEMVLAAH